MLEPDRFVERFTKPVLAPADTSPATSAPTSCSRAPEGNEEAERHRRPYVTLTYAQSLDGSIAVQRGEPLALSGKESMVMTHHLRAVHEGILVGIGTLLADNPSLTTRFVEGPSPRPIVLDSSLRTPLKCKIMLREKKSQKPLIACSDSLDKGGQQRKRELEAAGATIIQCPGKNGALDLERLLCIISTLRIQQQFGQASAFARTHELTHKRIPTKNKHMRGARVQRDKCDSLEEKYI
mmetsp:Transcript_6431/g.15547  ORF Transcript_6431/g.15547 Transcript_6431/m.15547 type:complete len:238 (-) Transcript_6431:392-1105(-)